MADSNHSMDVSGTSQRLRVIEHRDSTVSPDLSQPLKRDDVVLVRDLMQERADQILSETSARFGLSESLEIQAGFAESLGHRRKIGRYFMTVNSRKDYQFIPPHSEGSSFSRLQLAAFYCHENSTDGGETILLNVDPLFEGWALLRERTTRGRVTARPLSKSEIIRAKGLHRLNLPDDLLKDDDRVLQEDPTSIPGLNVVDVLAPPKKTRSIILERDLHTYWDSVASVDFDCSRQFVELLQGSRLLKMPSGDCDLSQLDTSHQRRIIHSGVSFANLFKCTLTLKLTAGDLIIFNNMTWAHSTSNWSPGSGLRSVVAAFA